VSPRVLLVSWAWPSHVRALLPLAVALRDSGDEVRVAVPLAAAALVTARGLTPVSVGPDVDVLDDFRSLSSAGPATAPGAAPRPPSGPHPGSGPPRVFAILERIALAMVPDLVREARSWRPDLVVFEPTALAGPVAAAAAGVPAVRHLYGPDLMYRAREQVASILARLADRAGVLTAPDPIGAAVIDPCPAELQAGETYPIRFACRLPEWSAAGRPPRISAGLCVTWGDTMARLADSLFLTGDLARGAADAGIPAVAVVRAAQRRLLGPLPGGVTVLTDRPLRDAVSTARALISHGGAGTVITGLAAGVPQIVVGQLPDHTAIGRRAAASGAAICLPGEEASCPSVLSALAALLGDPAYANAACGIAERYAGRPEPAALVGRVHELIGMLTLNGAH
jgi:UDP:flavonoid glycosyltransferase YjiC (YdhE family)